MNAISRKYRKASRPTGPSPIHNVLLLAIRCRVLDRHRKPLGYLDVPALKAKWEAGEAKPVRTH